MWQTIKRFFEPFGYYPQYGIILLVVSIMNGAWGYINPYFFSKITGFFEESVTSTSLSSEALYYIGAYFVLYTIWFILRFIFRSIGLTWRNLTAQKIYDVHLRRFFTLNNNKAELLGTGRLTKIINDGSGSRVDILDFFTSGIFRQIISILGSFLFIYQLNKNYFLVALAVFIVFVPILVWFAKKTKHMRNERKDISIAKGRSQTRFFMSKFEILLNQKIDYESKKYEQLNDQWIDWGKKQKNWEFFVFNTPDLLSNYLKIGMMIFVAYTIYHGGTSMAEFVGLRSSIGYITSSLGEISNNFTRYPDKIVDIEKLWYTFDKNPDIQGYDSGKEFAHTLGNIILNKMNYSYGEKIVFEDFSYTIRGGTTTALIGPSGGGKTTLIKLIAGYLQYKDGTISIDNQELPNDQGSNNYISLKSYYRHIGYLTQEPSVFDGSIKDNLMYAVSDQDISEDRVKEIIALAQCDWIYDLKDGLDTEIGEKGIKLSGGQRQRLAIAKIMLKDPSIILLDEPTSALDSFAEEEVTKAMNNLFEGRTVIIIAHRLQTVKHADEIIVLGNEEGKIGTQILERGNHQELIAKGGFYAKMLELQSGF